MKISIHVTPYFVQQGIECGSDKECKYTQIEHNDCHCPDHPDIQCDCPAPWTTYEGYCVPKSPNCGDGTCTVHCEYEHAVNKDGCPVCHCAPPPEVCYNHVCPMGQKCVEQEVQCFTTPCYPQPTCVPESGTIKSMTLLPLPFSISIVHYSLYN